MVGRFPFVEQYDETDCGPACISMVARYHGRRTSLTALREAAGTDTSGTNIEGLINAARSVGYWAGAYHGTMEQISLDLPVPFIAHTYRNNLLHYIVVYRVGRRAVSIADPALGRRRISREDFSDIWTGVFLALTPTPDFSNTDGKNDHPLIRLLAVLKPHLKVFLEVLLASVVLLILEISTFFYFRFLVDHVVPGGMDRALVAASIAMVGIVVFRSVLEFLRGVSLAHIGNRIDLTIVFAYFHHVLHLPMSFFDRRQVGEIMTRLRDVSEIRSVLSGASLSVVMDTILVVGVGLFLATQSGLLTLVALAPVVPSVTLVLFMVKPFEKNHRIYMALEAASQSFVTEAFGGIATVKGMNTETVTFAEGESRLIETIRQDYRLDLFGISQKSLLGLIDGLGHILLFWIGSRLILDGTISLGQLISFNALASYFTRALENLFTLQPSLQGALVASRRILEILDIPRENDDATPSTPSDFNPKSIEFNNVSFRYGLRRPTLHDLTFRIEPGERIGIVGPTGSGKSTIAKLMMKMYEPQSGVILLDGIDVRDVPASRIREALGYVAQEPILFTGTIAQNITLGRLTAESRQITAAAKLAHAHDFIMKLPDRYSEMVHERGSSLSGGERQRIALARVLIGSPSTLILDEATSALDTSTERAIQQTLDALSDQGVTICIIAHRLSTITSCDRILMMDGGTIVASGPHEHLLRSNEQYAGLWSAQTVR